MNDNIKTMLTDVIDVADLTDRLDDLLLLDEDGQLDEEDAQELQELSVIIEELKDNGGDHEWGGKWYPGTLINKSHMREYAQELAEEVGAVNTDATWPNNFIDWDRATEALLENYCDIEINGQTYYYR